jgi:hypothetical protein
MSLNVINKLIIHSSRDIPIMWLSIVVRESSPLINDGVNSQLKHCILQSYVLENDGK